MDTDALAKIEANPVLNKLYRSLLAELEKIGAYEVEVKKTSLHIVHNRAFLGIHPRKDGLLLNIVTNLPITSERLKSVEKVSANRYHNELIVNETGQVDRELLSWVETAYSLTTT